MWRWQGVAAVILALGITSVLILFGVSAGFYVKPGVAPRPLTAEEASSLTSVLGATVGALAVFLGVRNGNKPDPPAPPPPPPPPPGPAVSSALGGRHRREEAGPMSELPPEGHPAHVHEEIHERDVTRDIDYAEEERGRGAGHPDEAPPSIDYAEEAAGATAATEGMGPDPEAPEQVAAADLHLPDEQEG